MSTAVIKVDISQLDASDQRAIRLVCDRMTKDRRNVSGEELDLSTGPLRKAYYESLLAEAVGEIHKNNVAIAEKETDNQKSFKDLRAAWVNATPEQQSAALQLLSEIKPS